MHKISSKTLFSPVLIRRFVTNKNLGFNDPNHTRLVIIGAGYSGLQAAAHIPRLTTIGKYHMKAFDKSTFVHYTPFYDVVPFDLKTQEELEKPTLSVINETINIEFSAVESIKPDQNKISTINKEYTYDYLVLATGLNPNFEKIKGLEESLNDRECPVITTVQFADALKAKREFEFFHSGKVLFYNSGRAKVPYSGLNLAILFEELIRKRGTGFRNMTDISYITDQPIIFPHIKHSLKIQEILRNKNINHEGTSLELIEVDGKARKATFLNKETNEKVIKEFDLLYVNPESELPHALKGLADSHGYLDINLNTLAHNKYNNIFALGHCARTKDFITTPKAITQQSVTVAGNLELTIQALSKGNKRPERYAKYSGYTVVPLFVGNQKILRIELDPTQLDTFLEPSSVDYYKELYVEPNIYFKLLTQGAWFGESGFKKPRFPLTS
jgi:NADH dehydrogenase, FAD-containing subunit